MRSGVILVLVLAACGGAKSEPASAPAASSSTAVPESTAPASASASAPASSASAPAAAAEKPAADAGAPAQAPRDLAAEAASHEHAFSMGAGEVTHDAKSGRDSGDVKAVLDGNVKNVSACYKTSFSKKEITGTMVVQLTIEPSGAVSDAHALSGDITDAELKKCIFASYKKLKFAKADKPAKDSATQALFFGKGKTPH
jgi:hypothetical protein